MNKNVTNLFYGNKIRIWCYWTEILDGYTQFEQCKYVVLCSG